MQKGFVSAQENEEMANIFMGDSTLTKTGKQEIDSLCQVSAVTTCFILPMKRASNV